MSYNSAGGHKQVTKLSTIGKDELKQFTLHLRYTCQQYAIQALSGFQTVKGFQLLTLNSLFFYNGYA